jgi:hypothetical protein
MVGYLLAYWALPPWLGKIVYLEDIFVKESHRHTGVGVALMVLLAKVPPFPSFPL